MQPFFVIILLSEGQKTIRTTVSKKHDLSRPVFKNPGRYTSIEL